ncbi:SDR family oxidoreductase [Corallococcus sp. CA053C]|uniref:type I polyketide synthase n=1 Tax=Corallococcus sp. CA053C TaxID=2316732 RepID=UPI000EA33BA7|nr:type I polyketide synthase [Corallococcus sp. CA053C]RKG98939.1 SDR family oxidoreductase [Corallococcus sp. CA053C]
MGQDNTSQPEAVAIVGMALRVPGASDPESFWKLLSEGVEPRTSFSDAELDAAGVPRSVREQPGYVRAGFVLDNVAGFDAAFFGYSPREAELLDPQHRLFLECAWEALERAGYDGTRWPGAISVFAGEGRGSYLITQLLTRPDLVASQGLFSLVVANEKDFLATRVSHRMDLRGPSLTVQTACSTSLVAVHLACQSLLSGESDMALAGGVSLVLPQRAGYLYREGGILSPDGHCRPFDAKAEGTTGGSGATVVVLKRLSDALEQGDPIHAVIRGSATNNDGASKVGFTAPSVDGQARCISEALAVAGVEPDSIQYVEAHGTATPLGDPIEVAALNQVFQGQPRGSIALGSVKGNLGHMDAAAGVAGLIKTALALKHRRLPPSLHFQHPNPSVPFEEGPFAVNTTLRPWPGNGPARAGVSSFGLGGTNAHVVLEEAPAPASRTSTTRPWQLLVLSARSAPALEEATARLATHLEQHPEVALADVAHTLQVGRRRFEHRRVLVCQDTREAREVLAARDPRLLTEVAEDGRRPVAFLFPGQGSYHVDMGRDLYASEPVFREHVDACRERFAPLLGMDLLQSLYPAASAHAEASRRLEQVSLGHPTLFTVEYALARWWMHQGVQPQALLGHSIGMYAAACVAGIFSLEDAVELVALRGRLMQQLSGGAMLSVQLPESELRPLLAGRPVDVAAINAPSLCVASGPQDAVQALQEALEARGVECRRLHSGHAGHSAMMEPMLRPLEERLRRVRMSPPTIPCVSNLTGTWLTNAEATDPRAWAEHVRRPVRFAEGVATLLAEPDQLLLEVGPGQALTMLARQASAAAGRTVVPSMRRPQDPRQDSSVLLEAAGRLWLAGVELDGAKLQGPGEHRRVELPTYPFQREHFWVEAADGQASLTAAPRTPGTAPRKRDDASEWFYQPAWKPTPPPPEPASRGGRMLAFVEATGFGAKLVEHLRAQGTEVVRVLPAREFSRLDAHTYGLVPGEPAHYRALLEAVGRTPFVVHAWGLGPGLAGDEEAALALELERGFHSVIALTRALQPQAGEAPVDVAILVSGALEVTGDEPLVPARALVVGPCKVVPQEHSGLRPRCIDVRLPGDPAKEARLLSRLAAEVRLTSAEPVVAWRAGRRYVEHHEPTRLPPPGADVAPLRERGVYLITGGLGRIGLGVAEHLAAAVRARLVLVGRSPFPPREEWEAWRVAHGEQDDVSRKIHRLRAMEALGAEVLVLSADVSRRTEVESVVARAEARFGALHGVVHSAGSIGKQTFVPLVELERERCEEQLAAKVHGTRWLEAALAGRTLDFMVLQSSLSVVLGGPGFSAYAAANAFMDTLASLRARAGGTQWLSVDWDGWYQEGEEPNASDMTLAEGSDALRRLLGAGAEGRWAVSTADLAARQAVWLRRERADAASGPRTDPGHSRRGLRTAYVAPRDSVERETAAIWAELLGVAQPGIHDDFFELGGHSLVGAQVMARVRQVFQVELRLRTLFETPTIAGMAVAIVHGRTESVEDAELESLLTEFE